MKIATHDGTFHPDEIFAIAILKLVYQDINVLRTRNPDLIKQSDIRVDVGKVYNPKTMDFDHHQKDFNEKRENGIPYASVGLVWKNFWEKICSKEIYEQIDNKIIQTLDAIDSGFDLPDCKFKHYSMMEFISSINTSEDIGLGYDKFNHAVDIAKEALTNEIKSLKQKIYARELVKEKIKNTDKNYIILEKHLPWKEAAIEAKLTFVIYFSEIDSRWCLRGVPIEKNSFKYRKYLPKKWGGLDGEDLAKVTGVKDAVFCHKDLFIAGAKSKKGIMELVELALENNE